MRRLPSKPVSEEYKHRQYHIQKVFQNRMAALVITSYLCLFALLLTFFFGSPLWNNFKDRLNSFKMQLNSIDCEIFVPGFDNGSTVFIECEGENALIDSGTKQHTDELLEFIESKGIKKLDYLLISDANTEYTETLEKIINAVEIMKVVVPKCDDEMYSLYDDLLFMNGKTLWTVDNVTHFGVNKMMFEVIDKEAMSLKISFGNNSFLIYNFVDENSELEFINSEPEHDSDVLISLNGKLPSDKFFETFTPEVLVINGKTDIDISSAEKFTEDVYITDSNGNIIIKSDEVDIEIECENQ